MKSGSSLCLNKVRNFLCMVDASIVPITANLGFMLLKDITIGRRKLFTNSEKPS